MSHNPKALQPQDTNVVTLNVGGQNHETLLDIALSLAARGLRVFPLPANAKFPPIQQFHEAATTDHTRLAKWFSAGNRNIGIATGQCLMVIDADGERGQQTLEMLRLQGLPASFEVETPKGTHVYLNTPIDVPNSVQRLGPGCDVRGHHGYVVAPGSQVGGKTYRITDSREIATAPKWLIDLCGQVRERDRASTEPLVEWDQPAALKSAAGYLINEAPLSVEDDGGDLNAFKVAARVKDYGISDSLTLKLMMDHWNTRCSPPWDEDDLAVKVRNAYSYGTEPPGIADPNLEFPLTGPVAEKPRFNRMSLAASAARADEAEDPLIEGLLDRGAMSVMYGDSNVGKTFVALELAYCVATGRPWNGHKVRKGLVVYVVAEGGRGIHKRAAALIKKFGDEAPLFVLIVQPIDMLHPEVDLKALIKEVKAIEAEKGAKCELIDLDTLSMVFAGGEENGSADMGSFVGNVGRLRAATGAHVQTVHHTGKDKAKGMRGHSLLRAATDTEIEINETGGLKVTKQRDIEVKLELGFILEKVGRSAVVQWRTEFDPTPEAPTTSGPQKGKKAATLWDKVSAQLELDYVYERAIINNLCCTLGKMKKRQATNQIATWIALSLLEKREHGQYVMVKRQ